jgi:hypothetical protein
MSKTSIKLEYGNFIKIKSQLILLVIRKNCSHGGNIKWLLEATIAGLEEAAVSIEDQEKCTTSHVVNAELKLKYLLNQLKVDQYFAKIVI